MKRLLILPLLVLAMVIGFGSAGAERAAAATCSDFPNQAAAQAAANTRDPDGDGIYCESLPCPCSTAAGGGSSNPTPVAPDPSSGPASSTQPAGCATPTSVQSVVFSAAKYPNIMRHFRAAVREGWPRILTINRAGADQRRDRLLQGVPTRPGFDRDEYPPAVARGKGASVRGTDPTGWMASVQYVRSSENRSHGSKLGSARRLASRHSGDEDLVFGTRSGKPVEASSCYRWLRPAAASVGAPWAGFHSLRHGAASAWFRAGYKVTVVSTLLGHSTAAFTLSVYVHALPDDMPDGDDLKAASGL